jgi:hypothetical protein
MEGAFLDLTTYQFCSGKGRIRTYEEIINRLKVGWGTIESYSIKKEG